MHMRLTYKAARMRLENSMYSREEVRQKLHHITYEEGAADRKSYWYWRGWEIALGGAIPVLPHSEVFRNPELTPYYEMGMADCKGDPDV